MRGRVDPREKSVIVPGLSGKRICLGFQVVRSGVDTVDQRYCSRVLEAVEIRGIHESAMGPYLPRVRRKCPLLMGLYPPITAMCSSNQSAISQRDWGFLTVQGGVDPRKLGLLPRMVKVLDMWNDLWTGDGTLYPPKVELAQHTNHGQLENSPVGLGFPHCAGGINPDGIRVRPRVVGVVDVWMDSDPGM